MKIAIVYNRDSKAVINLFGVPNREKYGLQTIRKVRDALKAGGHQVRIFEGDKHLITNLEEFMPAVISGERPGLVFNLSYGIQGTARYTHVPAMLEMIGIPYLGSGPETHAIALDKVVTKMLLTQHGLPTPKFAVIENPDSELSEVLRYPLIVKPKDEAVSFGLKIVKNTLELREGVENIYGMFKSPTLVEEFIEGREINVALLGNDPVEALPPVELLFGEGEPIYTYEDKTNKSGREIHKVCPAPLSDDVAQKLQSMAIRAFKSLGCYDGARVDFRLDKKDNPYILEVNSMASLGPGGSFVFAAEKIGLDYSALANRFVEIAGKRYFGPGFTTRISRKSGSKEQAIFSFLTHNRDRIEQELKVWTNTTSRTGDVAGIHFVVRKLGERLEALKLSPVDEFTDGTSAWTWQSRGGFADGTLIVVSLDVPELQGSYPTYFRREPEWLIGEGIASSRAGIVCSLRAFDALRSVRKLGPAKVGLFAYSDEGDGMRFSRHIFHKAARQARQVILLKPGSREGVMIHQRRGIRKYRVIAEGKPLRPGHRSTDVEVLTWFLQKGGEVKGFSRPTQRISVSLQDIHTERFSMLAPHRISSLVSVSYLEEKKADQAETRIRDLFRSETKGIALRVEKISERPSFSRKDRGGPMVNTLKTLCEDWKLPFGLDSSLLPSPAGEVPKETPAICGFGPASRGLFTPGEAVHRGELLQRTLLLALFLAGG